MQPRHFKTYVKSSMYTCLCYIDSHHTYAYAYAFAFAFAYAFTCICTYTYTRIYIHIYILFITVDITEYYRVTIKFELGKYSVTLSWGQSRMNRAGEIQLYAKLGTINCLDIIHRHSKRLVACIVKLTDLWAFDGVLSLSSMDWEDPRINEMRDNDFGLVIWGIVIRIVHYGHWNAIF